MTNKTTMLEKIQQTADFLRTKVADMPKIAVISEPASAHWRI